MKPNLYMLMLRICLHTFLLLFFFTSVLARTNSSPVVPPANDIPSGAILITHANNNCSSNAAYTTLGATPDGIRPSKWETGPNNNVWFKFQATTTAVAVMIKTGGSEGNIGRPYVALHASAMEELRSVSNGYNAYGEDIGLSYEGLTIGDWYYINVDNGNESHMQGTFTLCINTGASQDYPSGAVVVPHNTSWCSGNAAYTTMIGTPDGVKPSAWGNGPHNNVWFKFQATTTAVSIDVRNGEPEGSIGTPSLALFTSGLSELRSVNQNGYTTDVGLSYDGLTIGQWYYITVDNGNENHSRGTFTLCVKNTTSYDYPSGAIVLTNLANWCSPNQAYTTMIATPDGARPSAWGSGPNNNVWFKFQATTAAISITVKTGEPEGGLGKPMLALHNSSLAVVHSVNENGYATDIGLSYQNLTVGEWYYINVDNGNESYMRNTFALCVDNTPSYDYPSGAVVLTDISDWCSDLQAYTTVSGSPDGTKPSSWGSGPNNNVWFKFQATTSAIEVNVKRGDSEGSLGKPSVALHNSSLAELKSTPDNGYSEDVGLSYDGLTVGQWYYINVDNGNESYMRGTFTMCVDDEVSHDYLSQAVVLTDLNNWCSGPGAYTTMIGSPDGTKPANWSNGPNNNVWFKFQAVTRGVELKINTGDAEGTLGRPRIALYDNLLTHLASISEDNNYNADVILTYDNLTIGNWYYITVDNGNELSNRGSFILCANALGLNGTPPAPPTNLQVTKAFSNAVELQWSDNSNDETGFKVERAAAQNTVYEELATTPANTTSYTDTNNVTEITSYRYRVQALNITAPSVYSEEFTVETPDGNLVPDNNELNALKRIADGSNTNRLTGLAWPSIYNWPPSAGSNLFGTWGGITVENEDVSEILLTGNDYYGYFPDIPELTQIRTLHLDATLLYGFRLAHTLPNLESLRLSYNYINEPLNFQYMPALKTLVMNNFGNISNGVIDVTPLHNLEYFECGDNYLFDIPTGMFGLTGLKSIYFGGNELSVLPAAIANLTALESLVISYNNLKDLPVELVNMSNLQYLSVEGNFLDFGDLELFYKGAGIMKNSQLSLYCNQQDFYEYKNTVATSGNYTLLNDRGQGAHTRYQWMEYNFNTSTWSVLPGKTSKDLKFTDMSASYVGKMYRCQMTNDWVTSVTLNSSVFVIESVLKSLALSATSSSITIQWQDDTNNETGFQVERSLTAGSGFTLVATVPANSTSYTNTSLAAGTTYYYRVRPVVGTTYLAYSAEAYIKTPAGGLQAYYACNGNLTDLSGYEKHGTPSGVTTVTDRFGNTSGAIAFDGVDDFVSLPAFGPYQKFTLMARIKFTSTELMNIFSGDVAGWYPSVAFGKVRWYDGINWRISTSTVNNNQWHDIGYIFNEGLFSLYVDGVIEYTGTGAPTYTKGLINLLGKITNNQRYFNGAMDDIRIYDVALTQNEIAEIFNTTKAEEISNEPVKALYNGLISSVRWHTDEAFLAEKGAYNGMYAYSYDDKYQIADARWATANHALNSYAFDNNKYRLTGMTYDANGNIITLKRYNENGIRTNNFKYHYKSNTNQLTKVDGYTNAYAYNELGQMVGADKAEGEDQYVDYDVTGKVTAVYTDTERTKKKVEYAYDDRGFRLAKKIYNESSVLTKTTWYIRDASGNVLSVYDEDHIKNKIRQTEIPVYGSGKLGTYYPNEDGFVNFEITDHLGNVRALVREEHFAEIATMEDAQAEHERSKFLRYDNVRKVYSYIFDHTNDGVSSSSEGYAVRLSGSDYEKRGLAKSFAVAPGDNIHMEVFAKYLDFNDRDEWTGALQNLVGAVTQGYGGEGLIVDGAGYYGNAGSTLPFAGMLSTGEDNSPGPKAYLGWLLFDRDFLFVDGGYEKMSDYAKENGDNVDHEKLERDLIINQPGYIYIYYSNDEETPVEVYFDDFAVTHNGSYVSQATDYGVWGDVLREQKAVLDTTYLYKYAYQGQFAERDEETGWNHFELREYDPVIGRWISIDPYREYWSPYVGMGNEPIGNFDEDGGKVKDPNRDAGHVNPTSFWQRLENLLTGHGFLNEAARLSKQGGEIVYTGDDPDHPTGAYVKYELYTYLLVSSDGTEFAELTDVSEYEYIGGYSPSQPNIDFQVGMAVAPARSLTVGYLRQRAVKEAWKLEASLVARTGQGTRGWTANEIKQLLNVGKVKGFVGHHIKSVAKFPQHAGKPHNIKFVRANGEHIQIHNGSFGNPTNGKFIYRK